MTSRVHRGVYPVAGANMARSRESIRQWQMLRSIAASRLGVTVATMAAEQRVTTRTIRRDLAALQEAGFPLYQERRDEQTLWRIDSRQLQGLDAGFTLIELCALHFSRATLEWVSGAPFHDDLARALARFQSTMTPAMRGFLDRLPAVLGVKRVGGTKHAGRAQRHRVTQLLDASLHRRKIRMRYHSLASARTKEYDVDPHRVVYAEGGLYLQAYVPEYCELRTFAIERIDRLIVRDEHFSEPTAPADAFAHSLGVHTGTPEQVEVEFAAGVAPHVSGREWHPSQRLTARADGTVRLELQVCIDWALRRWILGFGAHARVLSPSSLAEDILEELEAARAQYAPRIDFDVPRVAWDLASQRILPFAEIRRHA